MGRCRLPWALARQRPLQHLVVDYRYIAVVVRLRIALDPETLRLSWLTCESVGHCESGQNRRRVDSGRDNRIDLR